MHCDSVATDVFLTLFWPQWSSVAQRSKIPQAGYTHAAVYEVTVVGVSVCGTSVSHLFFCDESGVCVRVIGVMQRQALTQLSKQHGHFLHAPPATHQHHLGCHPVAFTAWSQHTHSDTHTRVKSDMEKV